MTNSRTKGAVWERKVAHLLSEWVGFPLIRVPLSGGWSLRADAKGDLTSGDTSCTLEICFECKSYAKDAYTLDGFLAGKHKLLAGWLRQVDNARQGKIGLLVLKRNHVDPYIVVGLSVADDEHIRPMLAEVSCVRLPDLGVALYPLSLFLGKVSYGALINSSGASTH